MNLRLVCCTLYVRAAPYALSHMSIKIHLHNYAEETEKLEAYARRTTPGAHHMRTLSILSLAHTEVETDRAGENAGLGLKPPPEVLTQRDETLRELLSTILGQLHTHTLRWMTNVSDPLWAFEVMSSCLAARPVREFSLDFGALCPPQSVVLDGIAGLQRLTVRNTKKLEVHGPMFMAELNAKIAKLVEANPGLDELTIASGARRLSLVGPERTPTLHDFLPHGTGPDHVPLALKSLSLYSVRILLDEHTLPHVRSLERLLIASTTFGAVSMLSDVWKTLRTEGIKLKQITTNLVHLDSELLQYLEYCKDMLIELTLDRGPEMLYDHAVDNHATQFFSNILPKLAPRLEVLRICTRTMYQWCFSTANYFAFEECKRLHELSVSIRDAHVRELLEKVKSELPKNPPVEVVDISSLARGWRT